MKIQWGRVVVGAVLLEAALIALFIPMFAWIGQSKVVPYVWIGVLALGFLCGWWVGRKVRSRSVLHSVLAIFPSDGFHRPNTLRLRKIVHSLPSIILRKAQMNSLTIYCQNILT